jgi:hypothetical protein
LALKPKREEKKMAKNELMKRIKALRKKGLSLREIEARFPKTLGAGNGTKAMRLLKIDGV